MTALSDDADQTVRTVVTQIDEMIREGLDNLSATNHNPLMTGLMATRAAVMLTQAAVEIAPLPYQRRMREGTLIQDLERQIAAMNKAIDLVMRQDV